MICSYCLKLASSCNCAATNCQKSSSDNVNYIGPNLACTGIDINDNLTVALQKIDNKICASTTTTTTTVNCIVWEANINVNEFDGAITLTTITNTTGVINIIASYLGLGLYTIDFVGAPFTFDENALVLTSSPTLSGSLIYLETLGSTITLTITDLLGNPIDSLVTNFGILIKRCTNIPITS